MRKVFVGVAGLLALCGSAVANGDPVKGQSKSLICIGCHGSDGNSGNSLYPVLAGQKKGYLIKQLLDFKSGARKEEHMTPMVEAISADDIKDIAAYFAGQTRTIQSARQAGPDSGKRLFQLGNAKAVTACSSCHGANGKGNEALNYPSIAGQHADYVSKMLKQFRNGTRSNDHGSTMRTIASRLSDAEIQALASYIASMR